MRKITTWFVALVAALALSACGLAPVERQSIAETAAELGTFDTLLDLLTQAELAGLFADDAGGPYTVFAPTDAAFAALEVSALSGPTVEQLQFVLGYHVLAGRFSPPTLISAGSSTTLNGLPLCFEAVGSGWSVNGITVAGGPVQATNGTIYVVDQVIDPSDSIAGFAASIVAFDDAPFATLLAAVEAAGLIEALTCGGPYTVFAPTDDAFAALLLDLDVTAAELLADTELLTQVLLYHVVAGALFSEDVAAALEAGNGSVTLPTLQGSSITVSVGNEIEALAEGTGVFVNDAEILLVDEPEGGVRNGVIHVIDAVLLPDLD